MADERQQQRYNETMQGQEAIDVLSLVCRGINM